MCVNCLTELLIKVTEVLCDQVRTGLLWLRGKLREPLQVPPGPSPMQQLSTYWKALCQLLGHPVLLQGKMNLKNEELTTFGSLHMSTVLVESRKLCSGGRNDVEALENEVSPIRVFNYPFIGQQLGIRIFL